MAQKGSEEGPFPDASVCFSKDEWKLLQEWQKDLYRNVMKEIHQALISLGPLITSTVFSLRAKENLELCPPDTQNTSTGQKITLPSDTIVIPDVEDATRGEQVTHPTYPQGTEESGRKSYQSKASPNLRTDTGLGTKKPSGILIDHLGVEIGDSSKRPKPAFPVVTSVFSLSLNDEDQIFKAPAGRANADPVIPECSSKCSRGKETPLAEELTVKSTDIVSVIIKEEDEDCSVDSERMNDVSTRMVGGRCMRRRKKVGESLNSSKMETDDSAYINLTLGSPVAGRSDTFSDSESNPRSAQFPNDDLNTEQHQTPETFSDDSCSLDGELSGRIRTQTSEGTHACTECEKSFASKNDLMEHHRTHPRERTHACTECAKSFFSKYDLAAHQKRHFRERTHVCAQCGKCFMEKSHLIAHYVTHSDEKKFHCTICEKGFNQRHNLEGHIRTHTGEKPFECTECGKHFNWKSGLVLHQRKHTGNN